MCSLSPKSEKCNCGAAGGAQAVRVLAKQTQGYEFKPQCCQKQKMQLCVVGI
jgi:hypothetical protein